MPTPPEADSQLYILDGRPGEAFRVETSHRQEDLPTNGAASGPKRRGLRIPLLVHEVVQEVTILRHQAVGAGSGVVRAEHCGELRSRIEDLDCAVERVGREDDVGVDEEQDIAQGMVRAEIPGGPGPRVPLQLQDAHPHACRDGWRLIGGRVIDDDDLDVAILHRGLHRGEALGEIPSVVVDGYDD